MRSISYSARLCFLLIGMIRASFAAPTSLAEHGHANLHLQAYVDLPLTADTTAIREAIDWQVKSAVGALADMGLALASVPSGLTIPTAAWQASLINGPEATQQQQRVHYGFHALLLGASPSLPPAFKLTLLAARPQPGSPSEEEIFVACADPFSVASSTLWYYFRPSQPHCQELIARDGHNVSTATSGADAAPGAPAFLAQRRFINAEARITHATDGLASEQAAASPDYAKLFGFGDPQKASLRVYMISGSDMDARDPDDGLVREYLKFLQRLLAKYPWIAPPIMPSLAGKELKEALAELPRLSYERLLASLLNHSDLPSPLAGQSERRIKLWRQQVLNAFFTNHWLEWQLPLTLESPGWPRKTILVTLKAYLGSDHQRPHNSLPLHAQFAEALARSDVFVWNGHSRYGQTALQPSLYTPKAFKAGYQLYLLNSCFSFTHFHDFFARKPAAAQDLNMLVNGLQTPLAESGTQLAEVVAGLLAQKPYAALRQAWGLNENSLRIFDGN